MRAGSVTPGFLSIPALAGIALTTSLCHAQVTLISNPPELFQYDLEEFSAVAARPGTAFAAIEDATLGIGFGEKLVGQINTPVGSFDVVNGAPAVPLTMDASVGTNFGVHLVRVFASTTIGGAGVLGFPNRDAIGEGSLTVLFGRNQRFVAFDLVGSSFGNLEILFFGRDGTLLDTQVLPETPDQSLAFKSEGQAIAAMTINNDDYGGVVYDNFRFNPGVSGQNDEACIVLGPDFIPFQADGAVTPLDAQVSAGFREASLSYRWATDCAEGAFDDATAAAPSLLVNVAAGCQLRCSVSLVLDDGSRRGLCTKDLTFAGPGGSLLVCPNDLTVESDGTGNVTDLDDWLNGAVSDDPTLSHDSSDLVPGCGSTGSTTVTWSIAPTTTTCSTPTSCRATLTIVDTTPPLLLVDTTPIVVEDVSCAGAVFVDLPQATATDASDLTLSMDAPEALPSGEITTVTYVARDACGNVATETVDVQVLNGAGVETLLRRYREGSGWAGRSRWEPLPGVLVRACAVSDHDDARDRDRDQTGEEDDSSDSDSDDRDEDDDARARHDGDGGHDGPPPFCVEVNAGRTNDSGVALIDLPPGRYVLVADVDLNDDGTNDATVTRTVGHLRCGEWKRHRLDVRVGQDGRHDDSGDSDD